MGTKQVTVERFSLTTTKRFDRVMATLDAKVGHPTMPAFTDDIEAASSVAEVEELVQRELGESGFVVFGRFDLGAAVRKELAGTSKPFIAETPGSLADNKWHHVVAVQTGNALFLYIDGLEQSAAPATPLVPSAGRWWVGGRTLAASD